MPLVKHKTAPIDADALTDIEITAPDNGSILTFNGTNWIDDQSVIVSGSSITLSKELNLNSNKISNLLNPTNNQDAATKLYVDGYTYSQTSTTSGTSIVDTALLPVPGVYNVIITGNPNSNASSAYFDIVHLKLYVTTGWDGATIKRYITVIEEFNRNNIHLSQGGPLQGDIFLWNGSSELTEIADASAGTTQIRIKVSGYTSTFEGSNQTVRIQKIA